MADTFCSSFFYAFEKTSAAFFIDSLNSALNDFSFTSFFTYVDTNGSVITSSTVGLFIGSTVNKRDIRT